MIELGTIVQLYLAYLVLIVLHELGHGPTKIRFIKLFNVLPFSAVAMKAKYRIGGLIVNVLLFLIIWYYKPESVFLQFVGLLAWAHFIIYAILGSIIPEVDEKLVNIDTHVFDDVPNSQAHIFIPTAIFCYILFKGYYLPVITGAIL